MLHRLAAAVLPGAVEADPACREIRFARGASSGIITGEAPAEDALCFTLKVGAGQKAEVRVESLSRVPVAASIPGAGDARESFSWRMRAGSYDISVFQLFRAVAPAPFRLRVSVTGNGAAGQERPAARCGWLLRFHEVSGGPPSCARVMAERKH